MSTNVAFSVAEGETNGKSKTSLKGNVCARFDICHHWFKYSIDIS